MSKRMLMVLTTLAMVTFDLTLNAKEQRSAVLMQRTAPARAATNVRMEAKSADAATVFRPVAGVQKAYSKREYMLLRRRYKVNQPQAYGALSGSRLALEAKVIRENMVVRRSLWPVVKDVIYGKVTAVKKKLDAGLNPD